MKHLVHTKLVRGLIALDLFMAAAATVVDWEDFFEVPFYLVPFVPICPLFPLLLAICFAWYLKTGKLPRWLAVFTAVGIMSYGIMALVFYPTYMAHRGFGWYELGNIAWVLMYSSQIVFLLPLPRLALGNYIPIAAYFLFKDYADRFLETFSYERYGLLSNNVADALFAVILFIHIALMTTVLILQKRPRMNAEPSYRVSKNITQNTQSS